MGIILFLAQVSYLSFYVFQGCMVEANAVKDDCYFQIYKQVPSTLPMVTAVAVGTIIAVQIVVMFFRSIPAIEKWPKLIRQNPMSTLYYVMVYGLSTGVIVAHLIVESSIRLKVGASMAGFVIVMHAVMPWLIWVVDRVRLGRDSSTSSGDSGGN